MVHRQFSSFLEGISYIHPEIWDGDWKNAGEAKVAAKKLGYKEVIMAQIYGYGISPEHTQSSFILESWHQAGRLKDFGAPLVFDRRNYAREAELAKQLPVGRPIILVAADGISSPFEHRDAMMAALTKHVGDRANVVDLAGIRTSHFHDFLGLIDRAACMVTIDTGFGQLAHGSKTPVCAFIANLPGTWYSSPRRQNHISYIRYNEFHQKLPEFLAAIDLSLSMPTAKHPSIRHVWTSAKPAAEATRRHIVAKETWDREAASLAPGQWVNIPFREESMTRSAKELGDMELPFIHDMLDKAAEGAGEDDVLLITNADISLVPGLGRELIDKCTQDGACYAYRWDFPLVVTHIGRDQIEQAKWYVGCDLFAMTAKWWREHREELPPFVIGRECWDWVFRELVNLHGGSEIPKAIYHEKHSSPWEVNRGLPGNLHNRSYARRWLTLHKIPLAEIAGEPYNPVQWPIK